MVAQLADQAGGLLSRNYRLTVGWVTHVSSLVLAAFSMYQGDVGTAHEAHGYSASKHAGR